MILFYNTCFFTNYISIRLIFLIMNFSLNIEIVIEISFLLFDILYIIIFLLLNSKYFLLEIYFDIVIDYWFGKNNKSLINFILIFM